jgi:hypothetical protein
MPVFVQGIIRALRSRKICRRRDVHGERNVCEAEMTLRVGRSGASPEGLNN